MRRALFIAAMFIAACAGTTLPTTKAAPVFNGGSTCMSGNDRVHPNCGPTPTPPPANQVTYNGCPVFAANDPVWNLPTASPSPDPQSSAYATTLAGALVAQTSGFAGLSGSHGTFIINSADSGFTTYTLQDSPAGTTVHGITDMPFSASFNWQSKGQNSDHHLMIVNNNGCKLIEAFSSVNETGANYSWQIGTGTHAADVLDLYNNNNGLELPLNANYPDPIPAGSQVQGSGSTILMGPQFPGLLRWEDYQNNTPHALMYDVPNAGMLNGTFVYPAHSTCGPGCSGTGTSVAPLGSRMYFVGANPSCVGAGTCPVTAFILTCLRLEGGYLGDQENFGGLTIRMGNKPDGTDPWSGTEPGQSFTYATDLANLNGVVVNSTNFVFVRPPYCTSTIAGCEGENPPL